MAVTEVERVYQWAETQSTAAGFGSSLPNSSHRRLKSLSSMPFIGEPWPTNNTGIGFSFTTGEDRTDRTSAMLISPGATLP